MQVCGFFFFIVLKNSLKNQQWKKSTTCFLDYILNIFLKRWEVMGKLGTNRIDLTQATRR